MPRTGRAADGGYCSHAVNRLAEVSRWLRQSVRCGCPFGPAAWVKQTALSLGLESTLRPRGRPRRRAQTATEAGHASLFELE
jgi:putative transposase